MITPGRGTSALATRVTWDPRSPSRATHTFPAEIVRRLAAGSGRFAIRSDGVRNKASRPSVSRAVRAGFRADQGGCRPSAAASTVEIATDELVPSPASTAVGRPLGAVEAVPGGIPA